MIWLVYGALLLLAALGLMGLFVRMEARILAQGLRWGGMIALTGLALFFALRGRFAFAAPFALGAYFLAMQLAPRLFGRLSGDRGGHRSGHRGGPSDRDAPFGWDSGGPNQDPGPDRGRPGGGGAAAAQALTRDTAWHILELSPGASDGEIRAAHRRLMKKYHPDHGGTAEQAARLNAAKDLLLRGR